MLATAPTLAALSGCRPPAVVAAGPVAGLSKPTATELLIQKPRDGWELGRVSWVDFDRRGLVYLIQRGDKADPVVVVNREGAVVRSWGKGLFTLPHSIRLDAQGNVWTTDASTSDIRKFSPEGTLLLTIAGNGPPAECAARGWRTCGVTDVAFAPNGDVYAADGYWNARIVQYAADGRKVREWGTRGTATSQFNMPHSIVVDGKGVVYVADRENSRVQRFDANGRFVNAWPTDGMPFSLELDGNALWIGVAQRLPSGSLQPTLFKVDPATGRVIAGAIVPGGHGLAVVPGRNEILMDVGSRVFGISTNKP